MIFILCFLNLLAISCQKELSDYRPTNANVLPFQALIFNNNKGWYTVGALISPSYVVTMANGIKQSVHFVVYLGLSTHPKKVAEVFDEKVQVISSSNKIFIHEDYGKVKATGQYIYDIGLLKLDRNASITSTVQVINLPPKNLFPLSPGLFANSTAFKITSNKGFPAFASVQLRSQTKCKLIFEPSFIESVEICVRQQNVPADFSKAFIYLPLVADGYLIGLGRTLLTPAACQVTSASCNLLQVYASIENALDWIYENTDVLDMKDKQIKDKDMLESINSTTVSPENVENPLAVGEKQEITGDKSHKGNASGTNLPNTKEVAERQSRKNQ
uniref:Peptidase S1 domain-containing protein n=1 Tax=Dendroctonus ponderosae TaxID=77166 RepID=A0AAR5NYF5_DENPD